MAWFSTFLEKLFPTTEHIGGDPQAVVIDIPPDVYYESLAIYTAASLISNAIGHSEVRTYQEGKPDRTTDDYYLLNVAPNKNETSSLFWHRVINKMIYNGEALIVDAGGALYCADSFTRTVERPILGDIYGNVTVGNFTFNRIFTQDDAYLIRLDNIQVRRLIDGMYEQYKGIIASAAKAVQKGNGQKYKLHIQGTKAGDAEFNKFFAENISTQLKAYLENDNAVYPEFDGYELLSDPVAEKMTGDHSAEFLSLRKDLFSIVSAVKCTRALPVPAASSSLPLPAFPRTDNSSRSRSGCCTFSIFAPSSLGASSAVRACRQMASRGMVYSSVISAKSSEMRSLRPSRYSQPNSASSPVAL